MTTPNIPVDGAQRAGQPDAAASTQVDQKQAAQALNSTTPAADSKSGAVDQKAMQDTKQMAQQSPDKKAEAAQQQLKADRQEDQKDTQKLEASESEANANDDYFQKVANDDKVFADPYREQARLERQREEEMAKGDPTRDPAAKQAAMDQNTPAPGALEEAEAMRQGKTK